MSNVSQSKPAVPASPAEDEDPAEVAYELSGATMNAQTLREHVVALFHAVEELVQLAREAEEPEYSDQARVDEVQCEAREVFADAVSCVFWVEKSASKAEAFARKHVAPPLAAPRPSVSVSARRRSGRRGARRVPA